MSKINEFIELIKKNKSDQNGFLKELDTNDDFFNCFFKYYPDGVYYIDLNGTIRYCNDSAKRILGCDDATIVHQLSQFIHETFDLGDDKWFTEVIEHPVNISVNSVNNRSIDKILLDVFYVQVSIGNEIVGILGIIHDITEFKKTKDQLKLNREQLVNIYENIDNVLWSADVKKLDLFYVSNSLVDLIGVSAEVFKEQRMNWYDFVHPDDRESYQEKQQLLFKGTKIKHQYRVIHLNKDIRWVQDYTIPILDDKGELIRLDGVVADITEQKLLEEKKLKLAYYDYLTELPNNRLLKARLNEMIKQAIEQECTFSLLYVDIDRFKYLDDTLGHSIGDRLLQSFSARLSSILQEDDFLARVGGNKFAMVVRNISDHRDVLNCAEKVLKILKRPFHIEKFELFVSTSIGITTFPSDGEDSHILLNNADAALNLAKDLKNNSYQIYEPMMKHDLRNEFKLESDLRRALVQNELFVEFQPRVDVVTNEIVSAEALVRWNHPEWGRMLPGLFIPLAEQSGLISDIGEWVLRHVCEQLKEWIEDGSHIIVPISVNLSAQTFLRRNWDRTLSYLLEQHHIESHLIEIEITERAIIKNEKIMADALKYLNEKRIKVALDDFGTGFSSLSYLKKFEIDTLKIDKSFIHGMQNNDKDIAIIRCVIQLAKELNIRVVAEGVETEQHLNMLKELECDEIQGFYFSKPLGTEQFRKLLQKRVL